VSQSSGRAADRLAQAAAPVLLVWLPYLGFTQHNGLPIWRPEILLGLVAIALPMLVVAAIMELRPETLRPLGYALLIPFAVDLQMRGLEKDAFLVQLTNPASAFEAWAIVAAVAAGLLTATFLLRAHLARILCASLGVMIAVTLLMPAARNADGAPDPVVNRPERPALPAVVHIILDEHIGPGGIPLDQQGGAELKRDLEAFFVENGFALFGNAFSHYNATFESLSNLMNGEAAPIAMSHLIADADGGFALKSNLWFSQLQARGYGVRVTRPDVLDTCTVPNTFESCLVYPSAHLGPLLATPVGVGQRAWVVLTNFVHRAMTYRIGRILYDAYIVHRDGSLGPMTLRAGLEFTMLGPLSALPEFDRLIGELENAPAATAWVAHYLLPHRSFLYAPDCGVEPDIRDWGRGRGSFWTERGYNSDETRAHSYAAYFRQVRCTMTKLGAAFAAMRRAGIFDAATIVVHGDHGSRIGRSTLSATVPERLDERDLIDDFSTLFAVRKPGLAAGLRGEQRSIHALFAEHMLGQPLAKETGDIYISGRSGIEGTAYSIVPMPILGR
jgi:hypothetical protein